MVLFLVMNPGTHSSVSEWMDGVAVYYPYIYIYAFCASLRERERERAGGRLQVFSPKVCSIAFITKSFRLGQKGKATSEAMMP